MTAPRPDSVAQIKETAAFWLVRLSSPDCTPEDRCAFEAWRRADPAHQEAYNRLQRGQAFVDRNVADPLLQELAEEVRAETTPHWTRRPAVKWSAIAATLLLALTTALVLTNPFSATDQTPGMVAENEAYETAIGERSAIILADGTALTLNTNSKVEVNFTSNQRSISLLRGQALFEVAKDVDRPFVVSAMGQRVVALGTTFDVRIDEASGFQVTLIEGSVSVDGVLHDSGPDAAQGATNPSDATYTDRIVLTPGQKLTAISTAPPMVEEADIEEITSWREGRLVFRKTPLNEVITEMNRYSVQQLVLSDDARLAEMTVSGVFDTGRTSGFVYALETMHPLKAERTGRQELTLVWRE